MSQSSVVVTGVSTGIGRATAKRLAGRGFHVFGSLRKTADAESLTENLGERFTPLIFDVTDDGAVADAARTVATVLGDRTLTGLVNNAGIAMLRPLSHMPLDDFRQQLEVNLIAPLRLVQAFLPLLGTDRSRRGRPGRIVNISSSAGRISLPFYGPYAASKHGLEGMSEALRRELMLYGIDVIVVGPGHVATEIMDKVEAEDLRPYQHLEIGPVMLRFRDWFLTMGRNGTHPERVATVIDRALTTTRPRPRYAVVRGALRNWVLPKVLPTRRVDRLLDKQIGLRQQS